MGPSPNTESSSEGQPKRRLLRYWILGTLIIVAAGLGLKLAKPTYHWFRARQGAALAKEAYAHIDAEDWKSASETLREAYEASPKEPEVLRALARFYSFADLRRQRKLLEELYGTGDYTEEDLREMISLELKFRDLGKARKLNAELRERFPENKENLEISMDVAIAGNDRSRTESDLERILALDPEDKQRQFDLAKILIQSSFEEKVRSGWERIYALAQAPDETGLAALRLIVRQLPYYPTRIEEIHALTKKHPDATEKDLVAALGWRYELAPSDAGKAALLEAAMKEREGRSHDDNRSFYFWLNTIDEHRRVLEWLPESVSFSSPGLLTVYVTALIQDEQFGEVKKILEMEDELESSSEISFIKAQCAIFLDLGTAQVREQLQEAYELALLDKRTRMLAHIAKLADDRGMREFARGVYESMANIPETSLAGYSKLMEFAQRRKDLTAMRSIAREIREKIPESTAIIKLTTYFDLLYGTDLEAAFEAVRELSAKLPADEECTMILAFAHYRMGDLASAAELARQCDVEKMTPSYRAVYAAIRGASGDSLEAVSMVEKLPRSLLLKEEIALVQPWILRL